MSDELQWIEIQHDDGDGIKLHWRAQAAPVLGGEYNVAVSEWAGAGAGAGESVFAVFHPSDGKPGQELYRAYGEGPAVEASKAAAQQHHNAAARAARWTEHMRNNEPPAVVRSVDHHN